MTQPQPNSKLPQPKSLRQNTDPTTSSSHATVGLKAEPLEAIGLPGNQSLIGTKRGIPAWLLSFLVHSALLGTLLLFLSQQPNGASEVDNRSGGIVLVEATPDSTEYLDEGDLEEEAAATASESAESPPPLAAETEPAPELPGLELNSTEITGVGESMVETLAGAENLIDGPTIKQGDVGGEVTTEVFGIKGTGNRFVYVFDRSKSMDGYDGRPMIAARRELLRSLASLSKVNLFQIIFYNDQTRIFELDGESKMFFATDQHKRSAEDFVNRIQPNNGTDHIRALRAAFAMGPDVIFLLTDAEGGFTNEELKYISRLNRGGATINAIQFGERRGRDRSLMRVAQDSGGTYLFKNIKSLQINGK